MKWDDASELFVADGSLRDLFIPGTTRRDWEVLLESLQEWGYAMSWEIVGRPVAAPVDAGEALRLRPTLRIELPPALHCHFFCEDEIELDLDPAEVASAAAFAVVQDFMARLGDRFEKSIHLTDENIRDVSLMTYHPGSRSFDYQGLGD